MKEKLIESIVEIIKDYRSEDLDWFYDYKIDNKHVEKWVDQFDHDDRDFILSELLYLLPNSYLSKENTIRVLSDFEIYRRDLNYETVQDFLEETIFLDCQESDKSQKILNKMIDEVLHTNYGYTLKDCGKGTIKNWFYVDDVLASGRTFKDDLSNEIEQYGKEKFKAENIRIIAPFIILHQWGRDNTKFALEQILSLKLDIRFYAVKLIQNNPRINYHNNPSFNLIYPIESNEAKSALDFIDNAFERDYPMKNMEFAFRNPKYPANEQFFSTSENRIRYENTLLNKGLEIMNSVGNLNATSLRPLGMTPPSFKTLGTGSHIITWRNISNTCPLVFWWDTNDWHPLFARKH